MKLSEKTSRRLRVIIPVFVFLFILAWAAAPRGPLIITPPPPDADPDRWVHVEGAANTRDAGNYVTQDGRRVRRGAIFRSGTLSRLSWAGGKTFGDLDIQTVVDLRNRLSPMPLFDGDSLSVQFSSIVYGCPMTFRRKDPRSGFYIWGVEDNAHSFRDALMLLTDEQNLPLLYHCAAGTDRTGVMSALLLTMLGVDRETVISDFRLSEQVERAGSLEAMLALLDHIEATGGIESFLEGIGVSRENQDRIRAALLE